MRKGLAKEIKNHSKDGLRADFTVTANLRGYKPDAGENDPAVAIPAFVKEFSLAEFGEGDSGVTIVKFK